MRGLPRGSALTAIFDSCTSGTLLGNVSHMHTHYPLLLIPRKTSTIISVITYIDHGSTRETVRAAPSEVTLVRRHRVSITCYRSSLYPLTQLGRIVKAPVLDPRADPSPFIRRGAGMQMPISLASCRFCNRPLTIPTITTGKGARPRNASLGARGGVVGRGREGRPSDILMWCVGTLTTPLPFHIHSLGFRRYPFRLPMTAKPLGMQVRLMATVFQ